MPPTPHSFPFVVPYTGKANSLTKEQESAMVHRRDIGLAILKLTEITRTMLLANQLYNLSRLSLGATSNPLDAMTSETCIGQSMSAAKLINETLDDIGGMPVVLKYDAYQKSAVIKEIVNFMPTNSAHPEWLLTDTVGLEATENLSVPEIRQDILAA
jgi:hypothetical protein